jgi:DNA-binding transcriptional MerR regulator
MFRIGEFARLLGISVRTLRHYEDVGLIRAARTASNGYREYSAAHLQRMQRILALRDMGFSLDRVKQVVDGLPAGHFTCLLRAQYADLQQEHARLGERLRKLEEHLKEAQVYQPQIRSIPAQRVASAKGMVRNYKSVSAPMQALCRSVYAHLAKSGASAAGPHIVIWSGDYGEMDEFELEYAVPIDSDIQSSDLVRVYTLPATPVMGVVRHQGSYEQLDEAYAALAAWLDQNSYTRTGPLREVYVKYGGKDVGKHVTEVHVPVEVSATA